MQATQIEKYSYGYHTGQSESVHGKWLDTLLHTTHSRSNKNISLSGDVQVAGICCRPLDPYFQKLEQLKETQKEKSSSARAHQATRVDLL